MYEIVTQQTPWKGSTCVESDGCTDNNVYLYLDLNPAEVGVKINNGQRMTIPEGCHCPPALKLLMERCWAQKPED